MTLLLQFIANAQEYQWQTLTGNLGPPLGLPPVQLEIFPVPDFFPHSSRTETPGFTSWHHQTLPQKSWEAGLMPLTRWPYSGCTDCLHTFQLHIKAELHVKAMWVNDAVQKRVTLPNEHKEVQQEYDCLGIFTMKEQWGMTCSLRHQEDLG